MTHATLSRRPRHRAQHWVKPKPPDSRSKRPAIVSVSNVEGSGVHRLARSASRRYGFTLVELTAVLVLIALFAAMVSLSLRTHLEAARFESLLDRVEAFDRTARREAVRRQAFVALQIDAIRGEIGGIPRGGNDLPQLRKVALGAGMSIDGAATFPGRPRGQRFRVTISPLGQSESYALLLRAASGRQRWLVVCGLSGQTYRMESDENLQYWFALPATHRVDAG